MRRRRFKTKALSLLSATLLALCTVVNVPVFAGEATTGGVTNGNITAPGTSETSVSYELPVNFTVSIPKTITLDATNGNKRPTQAFTVRGHGEIPGYSQVSVSADSSFQLIQNGQSSGVTVLVQDTNSAAFEHSFTSEELAADTTLNGVMSTQSDLSAGEWEGFCKFYIKYAGGSFRSIKQPVSDGLLYWYEANNNTGSGYSESATTWKDLAGHKDATVVGSVWQGNKMVPALDSGYAEIAFDEPFSYDMHPVTIEAYASVYNTAVVPWRAPIVQAPNDMLYIKTNLSNDGIGVNANINSYRVGSYATYFDGHNINVPWTQFNNGDKFLVDIVIDYARNLQSFYVNGVKIGDFNAVPLSYQTADSIRIGGDYSATPVCYNSGIYNFRMYDRALTAEEIQHNYQYSTRQYANVDASL